jgi:hypothetical protein
MESVQVRWDDPDRYRLWECERIAHAIAEVTQEIEALREFAALSEKAITAAMQARHIPPYIAQGVPRLLGGKATEIADSLDRWLAVARIDAQTGDLRVMKNCRSRLTRLRRSGAAAGAIPGYIVRFTRQWIEHEHGPIAHEQFMAETAAFIGEIRDFLAARRIYVDENWQEIPPPLTKKERIAAATDEAGVVDLTKFRTEEQMKH